jgi:multisubunit Na+/H+ antiporter MnhC subunit
MGCEGKCDADISTVNGIQCICTNVLCNQQIPNASCCSDYKEHCHVTQYENKWREVIIMGFPMCLLYIIWASAMRRISIPINIIIICLCIVCIIIGKVEHKGKAIVTNENKKGYLLGGYGSIFIALVTLVIFDSNSISYPNIPSNFIILAIISMLSIIAFIAAGSYCGEHPEKCNL